MYYCIPSAAGSVAFHLLQLALQTPEQRSRPLLSISMSQDNEKSLSYCMGAEQLMQRAAKNCSVALGSRKGNLSRLGQVLVCFPSLP